MLLQSDISLFFLKYIVFGLSEVQWKHMDYTSTYYYTDNFDDYFHLPAGVLDSSISNEDTILQLND